MNRFVESRLRTKYKNFLTSEEWNNLSSIHELLKVTNVISKLYLRPLNPISLDFKRTSEAMSNGRYPTIAQVLPFFHLLLQT